MQADVFGDFVLDCAQESRCSDVAAAARLNFYKH
jgi:hypothetical protein